MDAKAIQCQTCAGPLPEPVRSHSQCLYCGNVNKVLRNGNTMITGTKMPPPPKPLKQILMENPILVLFMAITVVFTPVLVWLLIKKKTKPA